jgi:hypothetical protein
VRPYVRTTVSSALRGRGGDGRGGRTHLKDILLPDQLFPLPPRQQTKLGPDETDLARTTPDDGRSAGEGDELVELHEGTLEGSFDEGLLGE